MTTEQDPGLAYPDERSDFDALVEDSTVEAWTVQTLQLPLAGVGWVSIYFVCAPGESARDRDRDIIVDLGFHPDQERRLAAAHCIADALTQAGF